MVMSNTEINRIVSNDREWRKLILTELQEIKKDQKEMQKSQGKTELEMNTLKVKVAFFGSAFGTIFGAIFGWLAGNKL